MATTIVEALMKIAPTAGEGSSPAHANAPAASGIAITSGAIWIANLRGARLRQVPLKELAASTEYLVREFGRLRDVVVAPDGALWVLTNNTDGRGQPTSDDDRILRVTP